MKRQWGAKVEANMIVTQGNRSEGKGAQSVRSVHLALSRVSGGVVRCSANELGADENGDADRRHRIGPPQRTFHIRLRKATPLEREGVGSKRMLLLDAFWRN
jgi:hypothetical protein